MKMTIVGIFDRKAQMFISLEPTPNIAVSIRQLTELVNKPSDNPLHKWPTDFSLWELGTWDNESGIPQHRTNDDGEWERKLIIECESLKAS